MPRKATGSILQSRGRFYALVTLGKGKGQRPAFLLPWCTSEADARDRSRVLAELAVALRAAGHGSLAPGYLERAAAAEGDRALAVVRRAVEQVCAAGVHRIGEPDGGPETIETFGKRWTSGELARTYKAHVRQRTKAAQDAGQLKLHIYPVVGHVPVKEFTLDHALAVLNGLPDHLGVASRRQVALLLHRLLALATFPARLIPANPIPTGFLPKLDAEKAKGWLYPTEDARLLGSSAVPLPWRLFYGFLNREGPRASEALKLDIGDVDHALGSLTLDENKTNDPRAWALDPGVVRALRAWRTIRERQAGRKLVALDPLFVDEDGERIRADHLAERFREHLQAAGVDRAVLFEQSPTRRRIWLHDTRATFITLALANGKTETWVQDRTGHRSSQMVNKYRRAARHAAELGLGLPLPLDHAIPELRGADRAGEGGSASGNVSAAGGQIGCSPGNVDVSPPRRSSHESLPKCRNASPTVPPHVPTAFFPRPG